MKRLLAILVLLMIVVGVAWDSMTGRAIDSLLDEDVTLLNDETMQALLPLPAAAPQVPLRVSLGERLFFDPRLSADQTVSCAACHRFDRGGADGMPVSVGIGGARGPINAPTVFNAALAFAQFWDGRAATLEEQAAGPLHNPLEMGSSWSIVLERLNADPAMRRDFALAYPEGLSAASVADAIASFERTLLTPDSPFDRYLAGERQAMSPQAIDGYQRFRDYGCISCHQGVLLGGNMYQKFGVLGDYFAGRAVTKADLGRYNVTGREEDKHVFKVPGLRNVALTAPYFHDGATDSLAAAVAIMGRYQLGRELSEEDVTAIVAFLESLTGKQPVAGLAR
ncbi:cytochrome-c peroxidase [Azonexus sp.]|uniref:cytochrome-c peroxidase n=1 Tax=Azonexus sp. TaxID=1872668 RepID=UPI0035B2555F